jgi:hypothetical protein
MNYLRPTRLGVLLLAIFSLARPASAPIKLPKNSLLPQAAQKIPLAAATQALRANIFFERNDGQTDRQVLYLSHSLDYSLFLTRTGATIAVAEPEAAAPAAKSSSPPDPRMSYFTLQFAGANPHPQVTGIDELPGKSNYFLGSNPKSWQTQVPQFSKVRYTNLYPGIDLIFYSRDGRLEYDLIAAPGADLSVVHFKTRDARATLFPNGDIALNAVDSTASAANAPVVLKRPYAYQPAEPQASPAAQAAIVDAAYTLRDDDLSFSLPSYDRSRSLVIDPALIFSTFITTNCAKCGSGVGDLFVDSTGIYLTGVTDATPFPASAGLSEAFHEDESFTFVTKLNLAGTQVIYSTYLGSSSGQAITVDSTQDVYVSGIAFTDFPNEAFQFPLTHGVFSGSVPSDFRGESTVAFAAKLSADGSQVIYATLLQQPTTGTGTGYLIPAKIAVDPQGNLYATGGFNTVSTGTGTIAWPGLPVTQGAFNTTGDTWALKLNTNASGLDYATFDGGATATGIAVDSSGDAFLTGTAYAGFPTTSGAFKTTATNQSAYVMELNPTGTAPVFSTLFADGSASYSLALDPHNQPVIGGSSTNPPPVTSGAFCGAVANSGYIAKFTADGTGLVYSSTICGSNLGDAVYAVTTDPTGAAYAVGATGDPSAFANILLNPIQSWPTNQVLLKVDTSGALQWATFLGTFPGPFGGQIAEPQAVRVAVDPSNSVYVLTTANFPTTPGVVGLTTQGENVGAQPPDFSNQLIKIATSLGAPVALPYPNNLTFTAEPITTSSSAQDVTIGNYGDAAVNATPTISITGDFSQSNDCTGAIPASDKCDVQVTFTPTAAGTRTGTLTVSFGGAAPTITVPLTGTGTAAAVALSPTSLSFGMQTTGTTSGQQQITVTNSGTAALIISAIATSSEFNSTNTCGGAIAVGDNCTIQVTFTPTASGSQSGTLTITDNALDSPQVVRLLGNQPPNFALSTGSGSSSASVSPGDTAKYTLDLMPMHGFTGSVSFTCSGAPSNSTCSISPNPASVTGTAKVAVTVSVATKAASTTPPGAIPSLFHWWQVPAHVRSRHVVPLTIAVLLFASLGLLVFLSDSLRDSLRGSHRGNQFIRAVFTAAAVIGLLTCAACGGSGGSGGSGSGGGSGGSAATPAGTYTLSVGATSGSISQTINLTLTVK